MEESSQPQSKPFRMQFDAKALEYYSYLRNTVETNEISYWIGNPSVSIINGLIALVPLCVPSDPFETHQDYLEKTRSINLLQIPQDDSPTKPESQAQGKEQLKLRSHYLVLCGIPNSKSPVQILENNLFGQYRGAIIQIRVVKTVQLRYYGMLLRFKSRKTATLFFNDLFGRQYNQIQAQCIVLREMVNITLAFSQIYKGGQTTDLNILRKHSEQTQNQRVSPESIFMSAVHLQQTVKNEATRLECSICLEQINVQIISILCGHYFHCGCLQRWEMNTCPLCRYHQQPPVISFCQQCNQCDGLWVCLICGLRLCCGNSNDILAEDSHIYQHYKDVGHSLSMQLQTKFIFDARVPAFLHQMFYRDLIQKGAGGNPQGMTEQPMEKDDMKKNKLSDKISMYQNQVAEEMQKQRSYFESNMNKQIKTHKEIIFKKKEQLKNIQRQLDKFNQEIQISTKKGDQMNKHLQQAEKEQKIIVNLQKMYTEKIQKCNQKLQRARNMQRIRLSQLEKQIQEKKIELLNFKQNLAIKGKIKDKLKGQTVEQALVLMDKSSKKKK